MILLILFVLFCKYFLHVFHPFPSHPIHSHQPLSHLFLFYPILPHPITLYSSPSFFTLSHTVPFHPISFFSCIQVFFYCSFQLSPVLYLSLFFSCWVFPQQPIIYFLIWPFLFLIFTLLTSPFPLSLLPCLIWYLSLFCIKFSSFL